MSIASIPFGQNQPASVTSVPFGQNQPTAVRPVGQPLGANVNTIGTQVPVVSVGANGLLELPYDQSYAEGIYGAIGQANDQLLGIKTEEDAQALEYQKALRDSGAQYGQAQRQSRNASSSSGTLFSSKYGTAVVNNAQAYANNVGEIEAQNTGFLQNANLRRTAINTSLNNQLAELTQKRGNALGDEAGTLGFGQTKDTPQNTAAQTALSKARASYKTYRQAWDRAQQLSAVAKRTGKPADKQRAASAKSQAEKLRRTFIQLRDTAKDYGA